MCTDLRRGRLNGFTEKWKMSKETNPHRIETPKNRLTEENLLQSVFIYLRARLFTPYIPHILCSLDLLWFLLMFLFLSSSSSCRLSPVWIIKFRLVWIVKLAMVCCVWVLLTPFRAYIYMAKMCQHLQLLQSVELRIFFPDFFSSTNSSLIRDAHRTLTRSSMDETTKRQRTHVTPYIEQNDRSHRIAYRTPRLLSVCVCVRVS